MHELSIIQSVVSAVEEAVERQGGGHVLTVRLRVGVLAGVVREALEFSYELATVGTLLIGSRLEIEEIPVSIYCHRCDLEVALGGVQSLRCPYCGELSGDLRHGRELEIRTVEIETEERVH